MVSPPEALLISAGFDAWRADPLGGMQVTERGFEDWGRWLASFATSRCQGRFASVIEGGYDVAALPTLVEAEKALILQALERTGGRIAGPKGAAKLLDINPHTLHSRMKKYGLT